MIDGLSSHGPKVAGALRTARQSRDHSQGAGRSQAAGHVITDRWQPSRAATLHTGRTRGLPRGGFCRARGDQTRTQPRPDADWEIDNNHKKQRNNLKRNGCGNDLQGTGTPENGFGRKTHRDRTCMECPVCLQWLLFAALRWIFFATLF